jgi:hypothetical protein
LAHILGCGVSSLPTKCLGLPLGTSYKALKIWNGTIQKMKKCFIYLMVVDLPLIKSTLSNLPTYFLLLFSIPMSVANRLEKL